MQKLLFSISLIFLCISLNAQTFDVYPSGGGAPLVQNANSTIYPGVHVFETNAASYTLDLFDGSGNWLLIDGNNNAGTNNITLTFPAGTSWTDKSTSPSTLSTANLVLQTNNEIVRIIRPEGSNVYYLGDENELTIANAFGLNPVSGVYDAGANSPDVTQAVNQTDGTINYEYAISVGGTTNSGGTPSIPGIADGTLLEVGDVIQWRGTGFFLYKNSALPATVTQPEWEAGTETGNRLWSPVAIKAMIDFNAVTGTEGQVAVINNSGVLEAQTRYQYNPVASNIVNLAKSNNAHSMRYVGTGDGVFNLPVTADLFDGWSVNILNNSNSNVIITPRTGQSTNGVVDQVITVLPNEWALVTGQPTGLFHVFKTNASTGGLSFVTTTIGTVRTGNNEGSIIVNGADGNITLPDATTLTEPFQIAYLNGDGFSYTFTPTVGQSVNGNIDQARELSNAGAKIIYTLQGNNWNATIENVNVEREVTLIDVDAVNNTFYSFSTGETWAQIKANYEYLIFTGNASQNGSANVRPYSKVLVPKNIDLLASNSGFYIETDNSLNSVNTGIQAPSDNDLGFTTSFSGQDAPANGRMQFTVIGVKKDFLVPAGTLIVEPKEDLLDVVAAQSLTGTYAWSHNDALYEEYRIEIDADISGTKNPYRRTFKADGTYGTSLLSFFSDGTSFINGTFNAAGNTITFSRNGFSTTAPMRIYGIRPQYNAIRAEDVAFTFTDITGSVSITGNTTQGSGSGQVDFESVYVREIGNSVTVMGRTSNYQDDDIWQMVLPAGTFTSIISATISRNQGGVQTDMGIEIIDPQTIQFNRDDAIQGDSPISFIIEGVK